MTCTKTEPLALAGRHPVALAESGVTVPRMVAIPAAEGVP